jgi:hypothetical protein
MTHAKPVRATVSSKTVTRKSVDAAKRRMDPAHAAARMDAGK